MKKTDVYLLSGFLGSGKTTLLKEILKKEKKLGRRVAVLMNELGEISIDSNEVDEDIPLKELLNGCVCCTIQDELEAQLQTLLVEAKPEVIYLETTGAAHPVETLDALLSPLFADHIQFRGIITVINGPQWLNRSQFHAPVQQLLLEQTRHASMILVNKEKELSEKDKGEIIYQLQSINPTAFLLLTNFSKFPFDRLLQMSRISHLTKDSLGMPIKHLHLSSFVYTFSKSISSEKFEDFLRSLPDTIYRIKGYVSFYQEKFPYLFQYSYGMPLFIKEDMQMPLNMVFIGENIDWEKIEQKLKQL